MFGRYNINDLFLASINVMYPDNDMWDVNGGGILMMGVAGYGYLTILRNVGDKYIDLQHLSRKITTTRNPRTTSYTINYIEPLSKYYNQDGTMRETFSRKKAIIEAKKYYKSFHQEHFTQSKEQ